LLRGAAADRPPCCRRGAVPQADNTRSQVAHKPGEPGPSVPRTGPAGAVPEPARDDAPRAPTFRAPRRRGRGKESDVNRTGRAWLLIPILLLVLASFVVPFTLLRGVDAWYGSFT